MKRKGDRPEKTKLVVRIDAALARRFKLGCVGAGVTMQEAATRAVRDWLRHERSES